MITKIQKWGNSQGVRLSKQLLAEADIDLGDAVDITVQAGVLVLTPARRVRGGHDLGEMVREIGEGCEPEELDWGPPAGREVW